MKNEGINMNFEHEIREHLEGLDRKQVCMFAWRCGIRALPLLSKTSGLSYWSEKDRQKHLYSIFNALDITAYEVFQANDTSPHTYTAVYAADARIAADSLTTATEARNVAAAAASAAYSATDIAANARYEDAFDAARYATNNNFFDLQSVILEDIKSIKNRSNVNNRCTDLYGNLWYSFKEDLESIGCGYWAQFYENLLNNGFSIDNKILKRHLGVPEEIKEKGAAAVGGYIEELDDEAEQLDEVRIIILGEKGAGKTSLTRKLLDINNELPKENESTEGVETHIWNFQSKDSFRKVNAHVWDFAGHSITHSAHRCFMSTRCLYIYVYNGRIERDNDPRYWLEQIRIHGGDSPVVFLINKKDDRKVDIEERTLQKEYPSITGYHYLDIGGDTLELEQFRQTVMNTVQDNFSRHSSLVSKEAYAIKNKLRESFDKYKSPHIDREDFNKIALSCSKADDYISDKRIEKILDYLHTLGICLWYNDKEMGEFNKLILNPDWITNGIYKIINNGHNQDEYILSIKKAKEILKDDIRYQYSLEMVKYLAKLMRKYELAFFHDQDTIFIPGILPTDMPEFKVLPSFENANNRLRMEFIVDKVLPPNIVARIMVQLSEDIDDEALLWRKGAVLQYQKGDATALITEEKRRIIVLVKGKDKTHYLSILRETIKGIFEKYKGIKPDLLYEIITNVPQTNSFHDSSATPQMEKEDVIRAHLEMERDYLNIFNKLISLKKTHHEYNIHIETLNVDNLFQNFSSESTQVIELTAIDLHECTLSLQTDLTKLANCLSQEDTEKEKLLRQAAKEIEQIRKLIPNDPTKVYDKKSKNKNKNEKKITKDENKKKKLFDRFKNKINKKKFLNHLKDIWKDLVNEDSELRKKLSKVMGETEKLLEVAKDIYDFIKMFDLT